MKIGKVFAVLSGAVLLIAGSAVAREANKSSIELNDKVVVEGKALDTGHYTVEWNGNGPTVEVTLLHGKDTVATFPARVVEQASANADNAYATAPGPNGAIELTTIYPGGKRLILQIDKNAASQQSNASRPSK